MRSFLVLAILVKMSFSQIVNLEKNNLLSRKRRFAIPASTGTTISLGLDFGLVVPLEGLDTSISVEVPFSYSLDLGR